MQGFHLTVVENFDRNPFEDALFFKESIVRPWSVGFNSLTFGF